jgi:hypothetical protein
VRNLLFSALLLTGSTSAHISQPSPMQIPQLITVRFSTDAYAEFTLSSGRVGGVTAHVGRMTTQILPFDGCVDLLNVHFDTLQLIREDLRSQDPHSSFTLLFDFGSEFERQHGHLPRVQLSYSSGKWSIAQVARATGDKSTFSSPICPASNAT